MKPENAAATIAPVLVELLRHASVEITAGSPRAIAHLHDQFDPGSEVFVNFLPDGDYRTVVDTAVALRRAGFQAVPHIAARTITGAPALADFLSRLRGDAAVDQVLLIAGDRTKPAGPYSSTLDVLAAGLIEAHGMRTVGIVGLPEGNDAMTEDARDAAFAAKCAAARKTGLDLFIVTQFCFAAKPILAWLGRTASAGIGAPVRIGVAGPATVATLIKFGVRCGVGDSLHALRARPNTVGGLLGQMGPDDLLGDLAAGLALRPDNRVTGIHFFPFGGLAQTGEFIARTLAKLYGDIAPAGTAAG